MSESTHSLLIGLFGALAVGIPAALTIGWTIYRGRKMGPGEEEARIAKSAHDAVETMGDVLDAAREERERMLDRIGVLEANCARERARNAVLERDKQRLQGQLAAQRRQS